MSTAVRVPGISRYFYFFMSILIVVPIVYGFSFTIGENLIHPAIPRPPILYVHAAIFSGWLVFFIFQSSLVRFRKVVWHRRSGSFGAVLGACIPILGVSTAITMGRFNTLSLHSTIAEKLLIIPLFDMLCFSTIFAAGIYWRKEPELHRRLVFMATCTLTAAGFGRFPESLLPPYLFYGGVDLLILLGVVRDLIVDHRINRAYLYVLPALLIGQTLVTAAVLLNSPFWLRIAHAILW